MIKFISTIDESTAQLLDVFLLENVIQECVIEHLAETDEYILCGYFEDVNYGETVFSDIKINFPNIDEVKQEDLKETDWASEYKKYCKPWSFQGLNWVPLWMKDDFKPMENTKTVYIDSLLAFGTGMHESTRLCVKALEMFVLMYGRSSDLCIKKCIDIGCGTGILGISALKLGLQSAVFIDNDEQAIKMCQSNIFNNDIEQARVEYVHLDLKLGLLGKQGDLIFANILSNVLIENVDIIVSSVKKGGLLCLSGILAEEMDNVRAVFKETLSKLWDSSMESCDKSGEWASIMFGRW